MRMPRVLAVLGLMIGGSAHPAAAGAPNVQVLDNAARSGRLSPVWENWFGVDRAARLDWARGYVIDGGTFTVVAPLVLDLWMGAGPGRPENAAEKQEAVVMFIYGYLRLRIDGQYCRDASSPGDLLYFYLMDVRDVVKFAATLPPDSLRVFAAQAASLERRSAAKRGTDRYVCSRGRLAVTSDVFLARDAAEELAAATREIALQEIRTLGERQQKR